MYKLRELEHKDIEIINTWRNDPELIDCLGAPFRFINTDVDYKWYDAYMASRQNCVRCAIVSEKSDDILGLVSIVSIDRLNQSAEFHIMIGDKANRGRGMGSFATIKMLEHAFFDLNLRRVELSVLYDNLRAQHVYEKIGFTREGIKREAKYKNGRFVDMYTYAILKDEFRSL